MSCRKVTIHGNTITSKTWNDIRELTQTDEQADKLYSKLASPEFMQSFGDWIHNANLPGTTKAGEPELTPEVKAHIGLFSEAVRPELLNFVKGLNITVDFDADELLDNMKTGKGELLAGFDVLQKYLAFKTGAENLFPNQVAHIVYTFLGKKSKLSKDLWINIKEWKDYKKYYDQFSKSLSGDLEDYDEEHPDRDLNAFAHKQTIVKFLELGLTGELGERKVNRSFSNPDVDRTYFEKLGYRNPYAGTSMERLWSQIYNWIRKVFLGKTPFEEYDQEKLINLALDIADDVYKGDYNKFIRGVVERDGKLYKPDGTELELKDYNETLERDPVAKKILDKLFANPFMGYKLSGSQTVRKYGKLYRPVDEDLHDIDGVIPANIFWQDPEAPKFNNWIQTKGLPLIYAGKMKQFRDEIIPKIQSLNWYKNLIVEFPNFKMENAFIGKDHKQGKSVTVTGTVEVDGQTFVLDFFLRTAEGDYPEVFDNYWKEWKQIFEAKLRMGRSKDLADLIYFDPFIKDKFKFTSKGFRYFSFADNKAKINQRVFQQTNDIKQSAASPKTVSKLKDWLNRVGVNWETVSSPTIEGVKYDANGVTDLFNKLIQISEGKEDVALAEEAMHIGVEVLQQTHPAVFNSMMNRIGNYNIYEEVKQTYSKYKDYQNEDGSPNINKLKKEAIAKLLAEMYINKEESTTERPELLTQSRNWFQQLIDAIKSLISKAGFNPFKTALQKLEETDNATAQAALAQSEGGVYLQDNPEQEKRFNDILTNKGVEITKGASADKVDDNGKAKEVYFVGDTEVPNRVTDKSNDYYHRLWQSSDITKSEYEKAVYAITAEYGTKGHMDMQHALESLIDKSTGLLLTNPIDDSGYVPNTNKGIYKVLKNFMKQKVATFPAGTRFLTEVTIYDAKKKEAGTIDFLAIEPDLKMHILDWKFIGLNPDKDTDVPWYKKTGWRVQMGEYRQILIDNYGAKPSDFVEAATIPIKANYDWVLNKEDGKKYPALKSVDIGDVNVENEDKDYLLPVYLQEQTTGDKQLDALIRKLVGLRENVEDRKTGGNLELKFRKAEQLQALEKAIRHLQVKKSADALIEQAQVYNKDVAALIDEFDKTLKGKDFETVATATLSEFGKRLNRAAEDLDVYTDLDNEVESLYRGTLTKEQAKEYSAIQDAVKDARRLASNLKHTINDYAEGIGSAKKVHDILEPEVVVTMQKRLFNETSKLPVATLEAFYQYRREAQNKMDYATRDENLKLEELSKKYRELATQEGWSKKDYFNIIRKVGTNKLIDEFDSKFYNEAKDALKGKSLKWIKDNIDVTAYREEMAKQLKEAIELTRNRPWDDRRKKQDIARKRSLYDLSTPTSTGWFAHYDILKDFPKRDKWESAEWKRLHAEGNEAAKDLFNWIVEVNNKAKAEGYIPKERAARNFLPFVEKGLMESILSGGNKNLWDRMLNSITMDEATVGYGSYDKVTGQLVREIPRYLTKDPRTADNNKELSDDLFSSLALYNEFVNRFKYISEIEGIALALGRVEKTKGSIVTSYWGKPSYNKEKNTFDTIKSNDKNADLYDRQIATLVYGQKYVESEQFDQLLGRVNGIFEAANKIFHKVGVTRDLFPTNMGDRQLSMNKSIDALNNFFQLQTLGLSPLPSVSNLFGGYFQSIINSGKYFDKTDFHASEYNLMSMQIQGEEGKKMFAAMRYFMPYSEDFNRDLRRHISNHKLSSESIQDFAFIMMRAGDRLVQGSTFLAILRNLVVIDGKIVNARDHIRNSPEYANRYTSGNVREIESTFEDKVNKLIEEKSLMKQATLKDGHLEIPGVDPNSQDVYAIRNLSKELSKKALGNMTPDEVRGVQQNVYLRSMMVFKNWLPSLIDTRFGQMKKNSAIDAYEWGRYRTVARMISLNFITSIRNMIGAVRGTEGGIAALNKLYQEKKQAYYEATGKVLDMTEQQFYDLVRENLRKNAKDLLISTILLSMYFGVKFNAPDPDEDPDVKNRHKFAVRALDKLSDELTFYFPSSAQSLFNGSIFPSLGVFTNAELVVQHFTEEMYGYAFDENLVEKNYVIKYAMKSLPVTSQIASYMPLFAPDLAKDLGIRLSQQARLR
jgi:hypothetical protein